MTLKVGDKIVLGGKTYEYMYTGHDGCEGCSLVNSSACPDCAPNFRWVEVKDESETGM